VEELRMHLAWRWFTGLSFDQEIPHHSTFSKNRHGRFQESKLFEQLFEQIVRQRLELFFPGFNVNTKRSSVACMPSTALFQPALDSRDSRQQRWQ
jgi:hypothetical protein